MPDDQRNLSALAFRCDNCGETTDEGKVGDRCTNCDFGALVENDDAD